MICRVYQSVLSSEVFAGMPSAPRNRPKMAVVERAEATPAVARAVCEAALRADVRDVLPQVRAPTRVLRRPTFILPERASRLVAELIPGDTFHILPASQADMSYGESLGPGFDQLIEVVSGRLRSSSHDRQLARGVRAGVRRRHHLRPEGPRVPQVRAVAGAGGGGRAGESGAAGVRDRVRHPPRRCQGPGDAPGPRRLRARRRPECFTASSSGNRPCWRLRMPSG